MADQYQALADMVIDGDVEGVKRLTAECLAAQAPAHEILTQGLLPGMEVVGQLFKSGELFIPEVLMSARAMTGAMESLKPLLTGADARGAGTVVIGTVEGDIHSIGKDLVAMMLEGAGFKVINLGIDVKPETFVKAVAENRPDIVAMSALLTTTMLKMQATVEALREAGLRDQVKIMAGGAPVSDEFVKSIGADAYASDAAVAVEKARALLSH
jgi:5-methyltetrahydrofolate--homocysteine methyltransferase